MNADVTPTSYVHDLSTFPTGPRPEGVPRPMVYWNWFGGSLEEGWRCPEDTGCSYRNKL
jgi:hypothetical protein